jgi:hypothetical protein
MAELTVHRRGMFRIGMVITAMSAMVLAFTLSAPLRPTMLWPLLGLAVLAATGLGLLFGARFARVLAGLLLLVCAVASPLALARGLRGTAPEPGELGWWLTVANAVATTALLMWLCVLGIQVVRGRSWRASVITARLAGGALTAIAVDHLWLAVQIGVGWHAGWAINVSPLGTRINGFPGWQLWHLAVLASGLGLLVGPRRWLCGAATVLTLVLTSLAPLALVAVAVAVTDFHLILALPVLGIVGLSVALAWWLRQALRAEAGLARATTPDDRSE